MTVQLTEQGVVVIGGTEEKTVVDMALAAGNMEFFFPIFERRRLRNSIWHVEKTRHATISCRTTFTLHVSLLRQPRLTEMHMSVDDARQDKTSSGIYMLIVVTGR